MTTVCPVPNCPHLEPCPIHPHRTWAEGHNGWAWARIRARVMARDRERCVCGARATTVHHVVALIDGGTDDMANLRSVCAVCHGRAHPGRHH